LLVLAALEDLRAGLGRGRTGRIIGEAAFDLRPLLDRQRVVMHVAFDPRAAQDDQLAHGDGALDLTREARVLRLDRPFDAARFALHQRGAGDVAFDRAVDVQIGAGRNIAPDDDIRADHRKGAAVVSHGPRSRGWRPFLGLLREHLGPSPGRGAD
jgi:hypothetical protein